jgi:dihydrofolate synthase/folylpolyglutamate synthase
MAPFEEGMNVSRKMTYEEAEAYLNGFVNYERTPPDRRQREAYDLSRVVELAKRLGDPQDRVPCLHVAGTKGKGSACVFADAILRAARLRVGLYTSPHLVDFRERIRVNGEAIPRDRFAELLDECRPVLEEMRQAPEGVRRPTYFEVLTHLAFLHFATSHLDVAVLEVGMGGRLDATNIISPVACGITHVSLDHTAILGETLGLIAREKAGILKPAVPAVVARQEDDAAMAIKAVADEVGAPLQMEGRDYRLDVVRRPPAAGYHLNRIGVTMTDLEKQASVQADLGLAGAFQAGNWAVAVRMARIFHQRQRGVPLGLNAIRSGSRKARWQGRMEEIPQAPGCPGLYLDGAHNEHSLRRVLTEIGEIVPEGAPLVVLFACARDKDIAGMLRVLADHATHVVFANTGNPRGCPAKTLHDEWTILTNRNAGQFSDLAVALEEARRLASGGPGKGGGALLAVGSLYLVGALKELFLVHPPF